MSEPFVGEVRLFAGNFAPNGWAFCDGQLVSIAENDVLFNLIGTTYGGDGQNTFALPDLRGRVPVHQGSNGQSGSYVIGESGGVESVTLSAAQMPQHTHAMLASTTPASSTHGAAEVLGSSATMNLYGPGAPNMAMDPSAIAPLGGGQPHENMPPYVALNYIVSFFGVFPSQN
jgi:microcystin-dependent protein